ncbi:peptidase M16 [Jeotgalibacillus proteolyticus]|uniref:Peptidase M16 n=2 Tax=Jeotgalibacillus proteolyticus TaxID=2082395 RepID=A0A2S5GGL1_9BACL|nr:pitrilysin family protein [Jeotgalibacillus proteolyticus]PPA72003.1 peptidase M16 [Jeotgalibacillus proteolyticus]
MTIQPKTVKNEGFSIHTIETKQFKTNQVVVKFRAPLQKENVTARALLPYILQSRTKRWPTTASFRTHLDDLYGATANVDVTKKGESHILSFSVDIANERYLKDTTPLTKEAFTVLAEILFNPLTEGDGFSAKVVEQEKRSLKQRLEAARDDKMKYATQRLIEEMCEGEPFALHPNGLIGEIDALTPEILYQTYKQMLSEDAIDLYVVGDVEHEDILEFCQELLPFQTRPPYENENKTSVQKAESKKIVERQSVKQGKLNIGYRTETVYGDEDYVPLIMMNGILGGFPHSKLFINVREKESLAYYAASRIESHKGLIFIMSGVDPGKIDRASTIIQEQLSAIQEGSISDKEVDQTRAVMKNQMLETLDAARGIIEVLYQSDICGNPFTIDEWFEKVEAVTKEQIINVSKKIMLDTTYILTGKEEA